MNKNLFELSQEEKNRIRGLHESYINKPGTKLIWENVTKPIGRMMISEGIVGKLWNFGWFEVEGSDLYYKSDPNSSEKTKIWEMGYKDIKFQRVSGNYEPMGYVKLQQDLIFQSYSTSTILKIVRLNGGAGEYNFGGEYRTQIGKDYFYFSLNNDNTITINVCTVVSVTNRIIKNPEKIRDLNMADVDQDLVKSNNTEIKFKESYIRRKRNENDLVANSVLLKSTPYKPDKTKELPLSLNLQDVFVYDTLNFVSPTETEEKINNFVNTIKNYSAIYGETFNRQLNARLITDKVLGYASIETSPSDKQVGKLPACSGKATNGEYNKCLSEQRAKKVADLLNTKLEGVNMVAGNFKYEGMGGTKKFGPGYPETSDETLTAPNRRITFNLSQPIMVNVEDNTQR